MEGGAKKNAGTHLPGKISFQYRTCRENGDHCGSLQGNLKWQGLFDFLRRESII